MGSDRKWEGSGEKDPVSNKIPNVQTGLTHKKNGSKQTVSEKRWDFQTILVEQKEQWAIVKMFASI